MVNNIFIFKKFCRIILFVSAFLEIIFFPSLVNIYGIMVLTIGWLLIDTFVIQPSKIRRFPISSFMLIGYGLFDFIAPMPLTLFDFHPVSYNLVIPYVSFTHLILYIIILVFTHSIYCNITRGRNILRNLLRKTNFYSPLSTPFIWTASIVGTLSMFFFWTSLWQTDVVEKTFMQTIMGFLQAYAVIPAILLFPKLIGKKQYDKKYTIFIVLMGIIVSIIGIMSNFRTAMYLELMLIATLYFFSYLKGYIKDVFTTKKVLIYIVGGFIVFGPMMNIATSMVFLRGTRTNITSKELLYSTIELSSNEEFINNIQRNYFSESKLGSLVEWDEHYINSPFLNRYCNLKINDACLYHASSAGYANPQMRQALWNVSNILVPRQLLGVMGVSIEKKTETSLSLTDNLYYLSRNRNESNAGAKIGSMQGIGMSLFSYWYLLIIIPIFYLIFYMYDAFVDIRKGKVLYSVSVLIGMVNIFNYFNDRHVWSQEMGFLIRNYWEGIIITCIFIFLINSLTKLIYK